MKIFVGADHRGFELKSRVVELLRARGEEVHDVGAAELLPEDDFNDYAIEVSKAVLANPGSFGVLLCGSAQGVCMQANRFKGIRAAFCRNFAEAEATRKHNDANVLCISADLEKQNSTNFEETIMAFLDTSFLGLDRYIRRNQKLDEEQ